MLDQLFNNPLAFFFWLAALVIAITVHEFAHAFAAEHLGDPTPRLLGRLTLNPLAHLDPVGTIALLIAHFGWGKPVPFDPFNLRHPRRDSGIISIAGPISNMLTAILAALLVRVLLWVPTVAHIPAIWVLYVILFLRTVSLLNVVLAIFNLVPIHPLDGFKIVGALLPEEQAHSWYQLQPYGFLFLLAIILPIAGGVSPVSKFISPAIDWVMHFLFLGTPFV